MQQGKLRDSPRILGNDLSRLPCLVDTVLAHVRRCDYRIGAALPPTPKLVVKVQKCRRRLLYVVGVVVRRSSLSVGMFDLKAKVRCNFFDDFRSDDFGLPGIALNQGVFANCVDEARKASGYPAKFGNRLPWEQGGGIRMSGLLQAPLHISLGLFQVERHQVRPQCNALFQLPKLDGVEFVVEFWLSDQQYLQQFVLWRFQVRQQPYLLQQVCRKMMCLIHYQHSRRATTFVPPDNIRADLEQQFALRFSRRGQAKVSRNVLEELLRI